METRVESVIANEALYAMTNTIFTYMVKDLESIRDWILSIP